MTLRTYIDRAIRDGADFDAVISGCDVQQTFCWQPEMLPMIVYVISIFIRI